MSRPQVFESKGTPGSQARMKQRLPKPVIFLTWFFAVKCIRGIIKSFTNIKKEVFTDLSVANIVLNLKSAIAKRQILIYFSGK